MHGHLSAGQHPFAGALARDAPDDHREDADPARRGDLCAHLKNLQELDADVEQEAEAARKHINAIIEDTSTPSDNAALGRLDDRIETTINDLRRRLDERERACC